MKTAFIFATVERVQSFYKTLDKPISRWWLHTPETNGFSLFRPAQWVAKLAIKNCLAQVNSVLGNANLAGKLLFPVGLFLSFPLFKVLNTFCFLFFLLVISLITYTHG